jgi:hypothetical protein
MSMLARDVFGNEKPSIPDDQLASFIND